jgi:DNA helicase-2/ATP-dependent DNA helicase PcrA
MLHGQTNYGMASSFLRELPEELLHWLTPRFTSRKTFQNSNFETDSYVNAFASNAQNPNPPHSPLVRREANSPPLTRGGREGLVWRIGQRVFHQKFGEGVVTDTEGSGNEGRVQVNFKRAGSKWLALEYAKLTAL